MNEFERAYEVSGFSVLHIRNRNESRVADAMRTLLPELKDFCGCRLCIEDVFAAALNSLTPQYAQTGSIVLKKTPDKGEVTTQVKEAFTRVGTHPKHRAPGEAAVEA